MSSLWKKKKDSDWFNSQIPTYCLFAWTTLSTVTKWILQTQMLRWSLGCKLFIRNQHLWKEATFGRRGIWAVMHLHWLSDVALCTLNRPWSCWWLTAICWWHSPHLDSKRIWTAHQHVYHNLLLIVYYNTLKRSPTYTYNGSQSVTVSASVIHSSQHSIRQIWVHISTVPFEKLCDFEQVTQPP